MLIIFAGLPGVGKSTLAKELARKLSATYVRIDTIEQSIRNSNIINADEFINSGYGYIIGYALVEENLKIGKIVVADSVNSIALTRDAWLEVADKSNVKAIEIEVICSNPIEHKGRVESRKVDISDLKLPDWQKVMSREYEEWTRDHIIIDTANSTVEDSVAILWSTLGL